MMMPMRKVPIFRPVVSGAPFRHWQMDLVDFQPLENQRGNHKATWMMTVMDVFSKYTYLRALKRNAK